MKQKSSIQEIEARFDQDVERFSNLETGQQTTLDAALNMELITECIAKKYPNLKDVLDIGCGAGNFDVKLLGYKSPLDITLVDLSLPMLERAKERVEALNRKGTTKIVKSDFRFLDVKDNSYDVIIATAVLHHLRDDQDWEDAFINFYRWLKPGGSIWIFDLVQQVSKEVQKFIYKEKYGDYLISLDNVSYRDKVFDYIEKEDTPRSVIYQLKLMEKVGFREVDIIHKNLCFASFVGFK